MRLTIPLLALGALLLAACGAYAPPAPTRSAIDERRTALAIAGEPTLPPIPTPDPQLVTPRPTTPPVADLLQLRADDPRALGRPDAPVLIVEFTDYE